ncbi:MAG: hypothetical protein A2Y64_08200 [Candidatus Coatesbacteria bacterium RBG_13_66_14]|uniref:Uncharacterized protein n=1 Tax=Candidatus Coatesbacteria bacterium RBG_13_66_14 TaxID=1817816 RepID=A0A1F5EXA5_9BACT|nr:MAG: hypothetical protein A2Y64_08200 [Candidatus Coatesbacteria bacterium RBG_13_66_14]
MLTGALQAAVFRAGAVGDLTPALAAGTLETVREAVEAGGGTLVGAIELTGGSLGYGAPVCRDADFVLRVALTRNPVLDLYLVGLEAASVGSGELFGTADAGHYPPGEPLQRGIYVECLRLMAKLPPVGRAEPCTAGATVRLEQPLRASRPALVYRRLAPDEEPTFPYLGTAAPLALVQMPPDTLEADVPLERGGLVEGELRVVVVGEALAEELARNLGEM